MKRPLIAALLAAPLLAHADAYRCKQADGSTAYQDHPCAGTAQGGSYTLPSAQGYAPPAAPAQAPGEPITRESIERDNRQRQAASDAVLATNARTQRCVAARNRLFTLNQQVRVYSLDERGQRVYVDDKDRPAAIATAQQDVADNCP